jgi:ribosomal protein L37AE/L43A
MKVVKNYCNVTKQTYCCEKCNSLMKCIPKQTGIVWKCSCGFTKFEEIKKGD